MDPKTAYIHSLLKDGQRLDGRAPDQFRKLEIETNVSATAEGSARVRCGDCEVIAGVKISVEKPFPDTPKSGGLMVNVELSPMANEKFESGPPNINAIELSRVIDRGIRESEALDTESLCIVEGEAAWFVAVDVVPINADGNLMDVSALAVLAAIKNARFPTLGEHNSPDYKNMSDKTIELLREPVTVTVYKRGDCLYVDPDETEEAAADARLTMSFTKDGNICAMQKGGEIPFTVEHIKEAGKLAQGVAEKLRAQLD